MSDERLNSSVEQTDPMEVEATRALLDQLLSDARLYTQSEDYRDLLDFVARLRNFAPFNAMLLHIQKPGLSYAASPKDWSERFRRWPKKGARPLLIMRPFGPAALVYDVIDTDGRALPDDVETFFARGPVDERLIGSFPARLRAKHISWDEVDVGDRHAGSICVVHRATNEQEATQYRITINRNHPPAVQFATLAHELAHLFLGHLGPDKKLKIPRRPRPDHDQREIEAESVAYIICERNGVGSHSHTYLSGFVASNAVLPSIDIYQIMRAAGRIETILKLTSHTSFERPN